MGFLLFTWKYLNYFINSTEALQTILIYYLYSDNIESSLLSSKIYLKFIKLLQLVSYKYNGKKMSFGFIFVAMHDRQWTSKQK